MILNNFAFYILFCSSVLIYGIGFNRESVMCNSPRKILFTAIKSYACVIISFLLSFGINKMILIPLALTELFPFFSLLIYITVSVFFEILIQVTTKKSSAEFAVSFLTLILALNEGISLLDGILITVSSLTCFYFLLAVLHSIEKRIQVSKKDNMFKQKGLIFLSMVVIMIALYSFNFSWLNTGVIKWF